MFDGEGGWMGHNGGMWMGGGFMWIFWILLIVAIVWAVIGFNKNKSKEDTPLEILKKRYARGEIDDQEYEKKRKELSD